MTMSVSADTLQALSDVVKKVLIPDIARIREARGTGLDFDRAIWQQMADLGWLSLVVPEELGGVDAGIDAAVIVGEQCGRAAVPEPYAASAVFASVWMAYAADDLSAAPLLDDMLSGGTVVSAAWQSERAELADTGSVEADTSGEGVSLSGRAWWVPIADADVFLVCAAGPDGPILVACPQDQDGLTIERVALSDGSHLAHLDFAGVTLAERAVIGSGDVVVRGLATAVDLTLVVLSAELLGIAERALEMTLEFLRSRKQFGQSIGSFQAQQHAAVDLWMQVRVARAALEAAQREIGRPDVTIDQRAAAASSAKSRASDVALLVTSRSVHMHGALGFSDEYDLSRYVNRALVLAAYLGNGGLHRRRFQSVSHQDWSDARGGTDD